MGQVGLGGCNIDLAKLVEIIEIFEEGEVRGNERLSYTNGGRSLNPEVLGYCSSLSLTWMPGTGLIYLGYLWITTSLVPSPRKFLQVPSSKPFTSLLSSCPSCFLLLPVIQSLVFNWQHGSLSLL